MGHRKNLSKSLLRIFNNRTKTNDQQFIDIYNDVDPRRLRTDKQTVRSIRSGKSMSNNHLCKVLVPELRRFTNSIELLDQLDS